MTDAWRERVWSVFDRAAELPPGERADFLDRACAGDAGLRAEVESLLAHDVATLGPAPARDFLKSPLVRAPREPDSASAPPEPAPAPLLPPRVSRYRVLGLLGQGGMGAVYEAEQDRPRRPVALKVVRPGLASPALIQRLAQEAQILARLHHPGIAQVYEAGLADDGQPFFAMEFVRGLPLDEYANRHGLDLAARVGLVARVCDAVQHAHDQGIIHRDLKPANILVDEGGQPKVLDFGVARATDADLLTAAGLTRTGQILGTPNYMSPEQVAADPAAIDRRADVYALGVILFELAAHRLPYRLEDRPLAEAARLILDQDPPRLGSIDPELRGDVETIVAKALEKDPARRYPSSSDLAADLRRWLAHEPIRARPQSALYHLRKFARRHTGLVGGVVATGLALVLGLIGTILFALAALAEKREAMFQAYRARLAAAVAAHSTHDVEDAAHQLKGAPEDLRGWEWRHLHARLDDSDVVLSGVQWLWWGLSGLRLAAFTPDALVVSDEEKRRIVSIPRRHVPAGAVIHFSDDTRWLAAEIVDHAEGVIRLRESTGRERILRLPPGRRGVLSLHFSPDGQRLAVVLGGQQMSICDVSACRETAYLPPPPADFNALAFSADGRRLAVAADGPVVSVWDTDTGRVVVELRTRKPRVLRVAFHPRGDRLLTASQNGTVQQWDLRTGSEVELPYERHEGEVRAVAYSPDRLRVASAGVDRTVRLWRADGRQDEAVLHGHTRTVVELAFNRDGRRLASRQYDGVVRLWDTGPDATLPVLRGHTSYVYPVAYTADGRLIASGSWDGRVRLWDAATGEAVAVLPQGGRVRALALSPDGERLVAMGDVTDGLRVWDVAGGRQIATHKTAENRLWALAYRPGGAHVAVLGPGHVIEVLDATTGERVAKADVGARLESWASRRGLAYSPDGRLLAGPYEGNQVGLWEADTYRLVGTLTGHEGTVLSVAFNAAGRLLASGGADSFIKVWDVASKECLRTLGGHADEVFAAVFHPDGSRIASGGRDRLVRLWDAATGEELVRLPGHSDYIYSLAFSPDGKSLASGSGDNTVRLWDTSPLKARYQARREAEVLRPEAERLVEALWRQKNDPAGVVDALRADRSLSEPLRQAALRAVLRRALPPKAAPSTGSDPVNGFQVDGGRGQIRYRSP
jgi:WD40 repeat protein/predicted Ser/Thr protein kinase